MSSTYFFILQQCAWLIVTRHVLRWIMWLALCSVKSNNVIRSTISQSRSCPIVLTTLGGSHSRLNPHLKLWKCQESNPWPRDNIIIIQVIYNNRFNINDVVTLFLVLSTGQNGTLDISLLFLHCGGTLRRYYSYARAAFYFKIS